jgi:L-fuconolactonase
MQESSSGPGRTIVDSHAHVWALDPETYPWQPTMGYTPTGPAEPATLLADMDGAGVHHTVLVQPSVYGADHRFLLETVEAHPDRFLSIGLVDPADPDAGRAAPSLVNEGRCVGLRVNLSLDLGRAAVQADAPGWAELEALAVPICLRATPAHHELVKTILTRHGGTRFVVDHLGLPEAGQPVATMARLSELSRFDNCWLKIAGLSRFSTSAAPYPDVLPVLQAAVELFGPSRMLWGSDFPFVDPPAGYEAPIRAIESIPALGPADVDRLLGGTACELWGAPSRMFTEAASPAERDGPRR